MQITVSWPPSALQSLKHQGLSVSTPCCEDKLRGAHVCAAAARWPRLLPGRAVCGRDLGRLLAIYHALYVLRPLQVLLELRGSTRSCLRPKDAGSEMLQR